MNSLFIHGTIAPLVVGLPLLVVLIVRSIVHRDAVETRRSFALSWRELTPLAVVTVVALAAVALWLILDARAIAAGLRGSSLAIAEIGISLSIFWIFSVPALRKIERAARSSVHEQVSAEEPQYRAASLRPRKVSNYLPLPLRAVGLLICVTALVSLAVQISEAGPNVRLMMPIGYGAIAAIFFLLYEAMIREEALGAQALGSGHTHGPTPEEAEVTRRRRVAEIFILQNTLTLLFSMMALVAIGIRWDSPMGLMIAAVLGVAGGIVGGVGCAFALSSEMRDRYLRLGVHPIRGAADSG